MRVAGGDLEAVRQWVADVRRVKNERNTVVHSTLGVWEEGGGLFALRLRRGEIGERDISKEELAAVESEVLELANRGYEVMKRIG